MGRERSRVPGSCGGRARPFKAVGVVRPTALVHLIGREIPPFEEGAGEPPRCRKVSRLAGRRGGVEGAGSPPTGLAGKAAGALRPAALAQASVPFRGRCGVSPQRGKRRTAGSFVPTVAARGSPPPLEAPRHRLNSPSAYLSRPASFPSGGEAIPRHAPRSALLRSVLPSTNGLSTVRGSSATPPPRPGALIRLEPSSEIQSRLTRTGRASQSTGDPRSHLSHCDTDRKTT